MRKNAIAYDQLYALLRPAVWHKTVLEVATGTGQVAKHLLCSADHIEATDASAAMIAQAKRGNFSSKLYFSVQDMFHLPYADQSFDVVIVSNALHIVPHPEKALIEFRRVLKNDGTLIAPTFTHAENSPWGNLQAFRCTADGRVLRIWPFCSKTAGPFAKVLFCRIPFHLPTRSVKKLKGDKRCHFLKIRETPKASAAG